MLCVPLASSLEAIHERKPRQFTSAIFVPINPVSSLAKCLPLDAQIRVSERELFCHPWPNKCHLSNEKERPRVFDRASSAPKVHVTQRYVSPGDGQLGSPVLCALISHSEDRAKSLGSAANGGSEVAKPRTTPARLISASLWIRKKRDDTHKTPSARTLKTIENQFEVAKNKTAFIHRYQLFAMGRRINADVMRRGRNGMSQERGFEQILCKLDVDGHKVEEEDADGHLVDKKTTMANSLLKRRFAETTEWPFRKTYQTRKYDIRNTLAILSVSNLIRACGLLISNLGWGPQSGGWKKLVEAAEEIKKRKMTFTRPTPTVAQ
uniref:Uncharacterized protein n=1 Tax=Steinernema glaseri TaxID=37863 RepID=A0A1I8A516_9BILA